MKNKINKIYLSWRSSKGVSRTLVGVMDITSDGISFSDLDEGLKKAKKNGYLGYPGLTKENSLELFSKRLIDTSRTDSMTLLDFWGIAEEYKNDKLYLLAMTQGILQTDNFEFLADYQVERGLTFVTDIAGLSHSTFDLSKIREGAKLTFKLDKENEKDPDAVKLYFKEEEIGYIKQVHNRIFREASLYSIDIEVKHSISTKEKKQLFVKIDVQ